MRGGAPAVICRVSWVKNECRNFAVSSTARSRVCSNSSLEATPLGGDYGGKRDGREGDTRRSILTVHDDS